MGGDQPLPLHESGDGGRGVVWRIFMHAVACAGKDDQLKFSCKKTMRVLGITVRDEGRGARGEGRRRWEGYCVASKGSMGVLVGFFASYCAPCICPMVSSLSSRSTPASMSSLGAGQERNAFDSPENHPRQCCSVARVVVATANARASR